MKPVAVVFDLYGTLLEIGSLETVVARHVADAPAFVRAWRDKQIAYAMSATLMERYEDFDAITAHALDYVLEQFAVTLSPAARAELGAAWLGVRMYPDALTALTAMRERGIHTAVFTNGTVASARTVLRSAQAHELIDTLLTVGPAQAFKPAQRVYRVVTDHFGAKPEEIVFVSSNGWDAAGASTFGLHVVWCNRSGLPAERIGAAPAHTVHSLAELPGVLHGS